MSVPSVVKGQFFSVAVDPQRDGTFTTICGMTTRSFTETANTNNQTLRDCDDPTSIPFQTVDVQSLAAAISGAAVYNRAQADLMRNLIGRSFPYRFIAGEDAQDPIDSGYYEGDFVLTSRSIEAGDGGNVTSSLTWASDGAYGWVPGAEIIILDILDLTPRTATINTTYTGTIAGCTAGSTVTVTSSDNTTMTVSGNGTTRSLGGTFTTKGNKTLIIKEVLVGASNTPRETKIIVVAS